MNERLRGVLTGFGIGIALLLLLQLSGILRDAVTADTATRWWVLATYAAIGAVGAVGVTMGRRDRVVPGVAALVLLLFVAPALPGEPLPIDAWRVAGQHGGGVGMAIAVVAIGALGYATVRGSRS